MIFGHVRKQENISIRRMQNGSVTDAHIGGYRVRTPRSIQRYHRTNSPVGQSIMT
jgi:hypothetical protein